MGRDTRKDPPGGWHHVTNRGGRRRNIFIDDEDRSLLLRLIQRAGRRHGVDVASFAFMGNHFHVIVHVRRSGLSRFAQDFESKYVRSFNSTHGYDGPLFKGRFTSVIIDSDEQLLAATRYVDRNPLELGYDLFEYPWSSYGHYVGERSDLSWIRAELPLELAGGPASYRRLVETDLPADRFKYRDATRLWTPQPRCDLGPARLDHIDSVVAAELGQGFLHRLAPRSIATSLALDLDLFEPAQIAEHHGYGSPASVRSAAYRVRQVLASDDAFAAAYRRTLTELAYGMPEAA